MLKLQENSCWQDNLKLHPMTRRNKPEENKMIFEKRVMYRIEQENLPYEYLGFDGKYKGNTSKIILKCKNDGYIWRVVVSNFCRLNIKCPRCSSNYQYTKEEYVERILKRIEDEQLPYDFLGFKENYDNVTHDSRIVLKCQKDGYVWDTSLDPFLNSGHGCPRCAHNYQYTEQEYIDRILKTIEDNNYNYEFLGFKDGLKNIDSEIVMKCNYDGNVWSLSLDDFLGKKSRGCPKCAGNYRYTKEEYTERIINKIKEEKFNYEFIGFVNDECKNNNSRIILHCLNDDNVWESSIGNFLSAHRGCPVCRESNGEKWIREFLEDHNIKFVKNKRFEDCCAIRPLPFDFYLPDLNILIEYDGKQHFEFIEYFHETEDNFHYYQKKDVIKTMYAWENNYTMYRFDYTETKEEILFYLEQIINNHTKYGNDFNKFEHKEYIK